MDNARQGACNLQTILSEKGFSFSLSDVQEFLDVLEGVALKLIITNVPSEVFKYDIAQGCFEDLFKSFDDQSKFVYLPSFHRVLEACTPNNQRQLLTMYPNDLKPIYNDCRYVSEFLVS
ncbi:unnamed protein product [Schistosoma turkestanicum]|nr:unnamed protein product [Schistosoma turkestanicum]